ncbi:MAG: outer membrane protein [Alphaproteobacteria bacterium]
MNKKLSVLALLLAGANLSGHATSSWGGPYVGATLNYQPIKYDLTCDNDFDNPDRKMIKAKSTRNFGGSLLFGHNLTSGNFIYGAELDIGTGVSGKTTALEDLGAADENGIKIKAQYLSHARARFGYVMFDNFMPYGGFGLSAGQFKIQAYKNDEPEHNFKRKDFIILGTSIFLGAEYSMNNDWKARLEFSHDKLSTLTTNSSDNSIMIKPNINGLKVGLSYKL